MRLDQYLEANKMTVAALAAQIGTSAVTVHRYISRNRIPHPEIMARIAEVTGGLVMPNDFFPNLPGQKCPNPDCPNPGGERRKGSRRRS